MRGLDIKTLLDIPRWEKVQDNIAKFTGTAIICIDVKGNPVTKHSCRTDFCSVIRENSVSSKRCFRCDALAGLEAVRMERPYIYLCHCGIVDVAIPVMVGDQYLGSVMFGQVRLPNKDKEKAVRLINEISTFQSEEENAKSELLEMYERLPEMEYSRIVEIADLIKTIIEFYVSKAVQHKERENVYQWLLRTGNENNVDIQEIQRPIVPSLDTETIGEAHSVSASSPIYPAVEFIKNHPSEKITMSDMATLCRVSESYFSRVFKSHVGENFRSFVNRQKINETKTLLRETNLSILQIALKLGYTDASTYIRHFKLYEGITPQVYRQYGYK